MQTELSRRLTELVDAAGYGPRRRLALFKILRERHQLQIKSFQTLQNWLTGERQPELVHLRTLLDALGVHGDERDSVVRLALPVGLLSTSNRALDEDDLPTVPDHLDAPTPTDLP